MKQLQFLLSLKNNLSTPLGKARHDLDSFARTSQRRFRSIGVGAAGLFGAGMAFKGLTGPAAELQSALDELSTRNIGADTLEAVRRAAGKFSTDLGVAAVDVVRSATTIRSTLSGLSDRDLPRATVAINTLAVATGKSSDTAAGYISALASTFDTELSRMGHAAFAENLASRTAWLIQNTGQDMARIQTMLQGTKGTGVSYGVGMDEQLAVLANLGRTVGASAGTAYDAFLKNARSGARELGVSFTDAQGKLLSFPDILDTLQAKYGDSVTGNIKLQEKLNKVFGKGAPAIIRMWGASTRLRKDIQAIAGHNGLDTAAGMAARMADNWARVAQVGTRVRIAIGRPLLQAVQPTIEEFIRGGAQLAKWLEMFPNIARQVGYLSTALIVLTAVNAAGSLMAGVAGMAWGTLKGVWTVTTLVVKGLVWALNLKSRALQIASLWGVIQATVMKNLRIAVLATSLAVSAFTTSALWSNTVMLAQRAGMLIAAGAMWAYGAATAFAGVAMQLLMSPIPLIVAGIALLAAGVWYAIRHWDELKASIMDSRAFRFITGVLDNLKTVAGSVIEGIKGMFAGLWAWLKNSAMESLNWMIGKMNKIPGVSIDLIETAGPELPGLSPPAGMNAPSIGSGGLARSLTKNSSRSENSTYVGEINVHAQDGATLQSILESAELVAP